MASNLLELRRAAGYRTAGDFAVSHGIPASTYARYESNPDKIPMDRAWQLADILSTTIDAVVGRTAPDSACMRGEVQVEYDGLTPEARALADEFREFVLAKDDKIRARRRNDEERRYDALCYQYERQMLTELIDRAGFGELVSFESAMATRSAFEHYLQEQAARKRDESSVGTHVVVDERVIEGIMAAYDRIHGESLPGDMGVMWDSISSRVDVEYCSAIEATGGDAKA